MPRIDSMPSTTPESRGRRAADAGPPITREGTPQAAYVDRNRAAWDSWAHEHINAARSAWSGRELTWGIWSIPESELALLRGTAPGSDVIELGCGAAGISALLARAGMRPVAVDISRVQLEIAASLQREIGPSFPLIHANAEQVPFDTESFDLAISEYGASLWCEPSRWLCEANRLLRTGGHLVFVVNSALLMLCTRPEDGRAGDHLVRDYFRSPVLEFPESDAVEFHLTHGDWVRALRASGFALEDLIEVRPPKGAKPRFEFASLGWAQRWPSEEIWIARKSA